MKNKYDAQKNMGVEGEIGNILAVCRDFMSLVNEFGSIGCVNHRAPSDKRFKLTKNGSYYELAGYCFTYGFMHDMSLWWTICDYDVTCFYSGTRMSLGEALVSYCVSEGITIE